MKELGKRLAEVEYLLKQMDFDDIGRIPKNFINYISENKDYEYSRNLCDTEGMDMEQINVDTIAILTYINMNYLNKIKVDVNNEQYTYENIFNQKKNITNLENDDKNNHPRFFIGGHIRLNRGAFGCAEMFS